MSSRVATPPPTAATASSDATQASASSTSAAPVDAAAAAADSASDREEGDEEQPAVRGAALIPPPATATTVAAVDGTSNNGNVTRATAAAPTVGGQSRPPRPPFFERSKEHFPARFPSWDEFDAFLGELCTATYQVFRKRSSVTAATHNRVFVAHSQKKIPPKFEFYSKRYQCTHGIPRRSRGVGMRNHAGVRDTGCTANVSAAVKLDRRIGAHFIQVQVMGAHNHPIGREQYLGYVENRKITDPALLRVIETMNALGKPPKDILAQVVAIVQKRTGEKCLYLYRDIVNALTRLKKDREQGVNLEGGEDPSGAAEEQSSAEDASPDSETDSTDALGSSRGRKRRAVGTVFTSAVSAEDDADTTRLYLLHKKNKQPGVKAKLSRLKVFLDSSYCYDHIHSEIEHFDVATMELLPGTISGFEHEVLQLTPAEKLDDVEFVLPRYVLAGCESGIGSDEPRRVTLSSRQLTTMKQLHLVRRIVTDIKRVVDWTISKANLEDCEIAGSFDEYADYTKDLFALSLTLLPLPSTTVFGSYHTGSVSIPFTDTIMGANIFKFGDLESNINMDCAKAALLSMQSRFGDRASFLNPEFFLKELISESCRKGSEYGAFVSPKPFVAGLVQLQSSRWGGAVLNRATNICYLYALKADEFEELDHVIKCLFVGYKTPEFGFVARPLPSSLAESLSPQTNDSGILVLLFLELTLQGESWTELAGIKSLDYYRMRYMLQAIQVVTKQNIHDIRW
ncbi:hypothetical protein Gpo141_00010684 [Globisporangium polare]